MLNNQRYKLTVYLMSELSRERRRDDAVGLAVFVDSSEVVLPQCRRFYHIE